MFNSPDTVWLHQHVIDTCMEMCYVLHSSVMQYLETHTY